MRSSARIFNEERILLADAFDAAGPEQPVLVGWTARDLLAHVVAQDSLLGVPVLLATPIVAALAPGRRDIARSVVLQRRVRRLVGQTSYEEMLGLLRSPPPAPFTLPMVILTRLVETWIHHEDLRRTGDPVPRHQDERTWKQLWSATRFFSHAVSLPPNVNLALESPGGRTICIGPRNGDRVTIGGEPGEVLLYLMGRRQFAHVRVSGETEVADRLNDWKLL